MEIKLGATVSYFLWSLLLGCGAALFYDLLRSARRIFKTSVFGVNAEDICFLFLCGFLLFWTAYDKNEGQLRWQGFLGSLLGFLVYRWLFKDRLVAFFVKVHDFLVRIFLWMMKILLFPVQLIYKILSKPFLVIAWYSRKRVLEVEDRIKAKRKCKKIRKKTQKAEMEKRRKHKKEAKIKKRQQRRKPAQKSVVKKTQ